MLRLLTCALPALYLAACIPEPKDGCRTEADCLAGRVCVLGTCQGLHRDASSGGTAETASVDDVENRPSDGRETGLPDALADRADASAPATAGGSDAPLGSPPDGEERAIDLDGHAKDLGSDMAEGISLFADVWTPSIDQGLDMPRVEVDAPLVQSNDGTDGADGGFESVGILGTADTALPNGNAVDSGGAPGTGGVAGTGGIIGSGGTTGGDAPIETTPDGATSEQTVATGAVSVANAVFTNVPTWSDVQIYAQFKLVRTVRFLYGTDHPNFARRVSWLDPNGGAEDKAELFVGEVKADCGVPPCQPYKLFVWAKDASARLKVTIDGHDVEWSWHVAPIVRSATSGEVFVFDPTIEAKQPLPWKDWLLKMAPSLDSVLVTVADSKAYNLDSPISGGASQHNLALQKMLTQWLPEEWNYQQNLGHEPEGVLGSSPPWGSEKQYLVSYDPVTMVSACRTCLQDIFSARCLADCP